MDTIKLVLYGASDDLAEIDNPIRLEGIDGIPTGGEELYVNRKGVASGKFHHDDGQGTVTGMYVTWVYDASFHNGCWGILVAPLDEGIPMFEYRAEPTGEDTPYRDYSAAVAVFVPVGSSFEDVTDRE